MDYSVELKWLVCGLRRPGCIHVLKGRPGTGDLWRSGVTYSRTDHLAGLVIRPWGRCVQDSRPSHLNQGWLFVVKVRFLAGNLVPSMGWTKGGNRGIESRRGVGRYSRTSPQSCWKGCVKKTSLRPTCFLFCVLYRFRAFRWYWGSTFFRSLVPASCGWRLKILRSFQDFYSARARRGGGIVELSCVD